MEKKKQPAVSLQVTDGGEAQTNICASNYADACQVGPVTPGRCDIVLACNSPLETPNSHKVI